MNCFPGSVGRRGAMLQHPHMPDVGIDDIKDLAAHRLDLGDAPASPAVRKAQMLGAKAELIAAGALPVRKRQSDPVDNHRAVACCRR